LPGYIESRPTSTLVLGGSVEYQITLSPSLYKEMPVQLAYQITLSPFLVPGNAMATRVSDYTAHRPLVCVQGNTMAT